MVDKLDRITTGIERIDRMLTALWDNHIGAVYLAQSTDVVPFIKNLLKDGEMVGAGGSRFWSTRG